MSSIPHTSPRLVVGVGSLLLAAAATYLALRAPGFPGDVRSWPRTLAGRLRRDVPRGDRTTAAWVGVAVWSALVAGLHFGGLHYGVYTARPWWDLLTHAMGGVGVAAVLATTHRRSVAAGRPTWWLIPSILAIGAGFEVYEFVFKSFWHGWSLRFYVVDTVVDLLINTSGAVLVAVALAGYRSIVGADAGDATPEGVMAGDAMAESAAAKDATADDSTAGDAAANDAATGAEPSK